MDLAAQEFVDARYEWPRNFVAAHGTLLAMLLEPVANTLNAKAVAAGQRCGLDHEIVADWAVVCLNFFEFFHFY